MEDVPYGRILREGWSIIVIAAVLCALAAWGVTKFLPQTYSASSTLMLQVDSSQTSLFERSQFSMARIKTYPALVDSQEVIDGVRADLGLSPDDYSDNHLRALLSAEITDDTVLLEVVAEAAEGQLSADIANSAARHLSELVEDTENIDGDEQSEVALDQVLLAVAPTSSVSPNVTAISGLGLIVGFALGSIVAVYRTTTRRRLLTVADVRRGSGLAVVGQLPRPRRLGADTDPSALVAYQEIVGNLVTLGGSDRSVYAVAPVTTTALDDDTISGLLEAYSSLGTLACVVDVRATPIRTSELHLVSDLFDRDGEGVAVTQAGTEAVSFYVADVPVSTPESADAFLEAVRLLGESHDVIILVCDSASTMLLERLARQGAGVVVAVQHNMTQAAELNAVVTRQRVQGIRPVGVLMTHTPRGSTESVSESWRVSDREIAESSEQCRNEERNKSEGRTHSTECRDATVTGRGRRVG